MDLPFHAAELEALYTRTLGAGLPSLAITAPRYGCGTTTLALALARRAAAAGRRTLLVEFNTVRPAVARLLDLPEDDWALHDGTAHIAGVRLPDTPLSILPASRRGGSIASREPRVIEAAFRQWSSDHDCVVADLPPVDVPGHGGLPAPSICAAAAGTLLVVLARRSRATEVEAATRALSEAGARLLGCVVNDRFNPTLGQELARELNRLGRFLPGPLRRLATQLEQSELLSLRS